MTGMQLCTSYLLDMLPNVLNACTALGMDMNVVHAVRQPLSEKAETFSQLVLNDDNASARSTPIWLAIKCIGKKRCVLPQPNHIQSSPRTHLNISIAKSTKYSGINYFNRCFIQFLLCNKPCVGISFFMWTRGNWCQIVDSCPSNNVKTLCSNYIFSLRNRLRARLGSK